MVDLTTPARGRSAVGVGIERLLWALAAIVALLVVIEVLLQYRAAYKVANPSDQSRLAQLTRDYAPFSIHHVHPHYLFFFPLQRHDRLAMGNATCSLDSMGFREPGLAHAGGRKLAFMLGGSAAFGYYASSNQATITSQLNRLQDEYFFVNAAVPGWNSTQQLFRMAVEIADYQPALVISYDGANDAAQTVLTNPERPADSYPAGTPENFDELELRLAALEAGVAWPGITGLFPEIALRVDKYRAELGWSAPPAEEAVDLSGVEPAARRYLANQQRMAQLTRAAGGRFITVFQPIATLHRNVPAGNLGADDDPRAFHEHVRRLGAASLEFHDFSSLFDEYFAAVPMATSDVRDDSVFVDAVHLYDRGNELVARRLLRVIAAPAGR